MHPSWSVVLVLLSLWCFEAAEATFFGLGKGRGDVDVRLYNRYPRPDPAKFRKLEKGDPAGIVVTARGPSWRIVPEGSSYPLKLSSSIYVPDRLKTSLHATLKVALVDNTILALAGDTEVVVQDYVYQDNEWKGRLSLKQGTLRFLVGDLAKWSPESFEVETGLATVGIRGSGGYLRYNGSFLEVATLPGHVLDVWTRWGDHWVIDQPRVGLQVDAQGNVRPMAVPPGYFGHEAFYLETRTETLAWPTPSIPSRQPQPVPMPADRWYRSEEVFHRRRQRRRNTDKEREKPSAEPLLQRLAAEQLRGGARKALRTESVDREQASTLPVLRRLGKEIQKENEGRSSLKGRLSNEEAH